MSALAVAEPGGDTEIAGARLTVLKCGALHWPQTRTLIVSDLHLEKGSAQAERGHFLPPYDTAATLARLALAIEATRPRRVVALGDSFHDARALDRIADADRAMIRTLQAGRDWVWIAGNHDEGLFGRFPGDHQTVLADGPLHFVHEPKPGPAPGEIAGHLHPVAKVAGTGRTVRRRCFATDGARLVMPAYGAFTGGLNVRDPAFAPIFTRGAEVFVLGEQRVYRVGRARCLPDR